MLVVGVIVCVGSGVVGEIVVGIPVAPFVLKFIDCGLLQSLVESTYVLFMGIPSMISNGGGKFVAICTSK